MSTTMTSDKTTLSSAEYLNEVVPVKKNFLNDVMFTSPVTQTFNYAISFPAMNNNVTISYEIDQIWTPNVIFRVVTIAAVMFLTLAGNVSLIAVISCHASLRSKRVSIFLLNLAVADLMVCFFTMTSEILFVAFGQWVLGAVACKVIVYGQIVTLASTTFLLTAMSIDRYQVLVQPLRSPQGQHHIWYRMLCSWLLAMIFATPQLFIFVQTEEPQEDGRLVRQCRSSGYTAEWQRKVYFSYMTLYILIIPTIIMTFCYSSIIRVVWMRTADSTRPDIDAPKIHFVASHRRSNFPRNQTPVQSMRTGHNSYRSALVYGTQPGTEYRVDARTSWKSAIPRKVAISSKRNVIKMTLTVIVGFVVCWTPYFVVSLIRIFSDYRIQLENALSVSEIMALVHSALNPILYMLFSTRTVRSLCWPVSQRRLVDLGRCCCDGWGYLVRNCLHMKSTRPTRLTRTSPDSSTLREEQPKNAEMELQARQVEQNNSNRKYSGHYGSCGQPIRYSSGDGASTSSGRYREAGPQSGIVHGIRRTGRLPSLEFIYLRDRILSNDVRPVNYLNLRGLNARTIRANVERSEGFRSDVNSRYQDAASVSTCAITY